MLLFRTQSAYLAFIILGLSQSVRLISQHQPMRPERPRSPALPPRWVGDIWRVWRQALCVWCQLYCFVNLVSVCVCLGLCLICVSCVCGHGCISSDKVVLNMFAQGPQKKKSILTHEGLEPPTAHTHTHTRIH